MYCNNCGTQNADGAGFCSACGTPLQVAPQETTALNQEKSVPYTDSSNMNIYQPLVCPNCKKAIDGDNIIFCPNCGTKIDDTAPSSQVNIIRDGAKKIAENELVKSAKSDIKNSQLIGTVKSKAKSTTGKIKTADAGKKKIAIIAVTLIALLLIVTNIHRCEECDDLYFGKKYVISFFGEHEEVCKDCYYDFYGWR